MSDSRNAIVLDLGSHSFKVGLASEEPPNSTVPSIYGVDGHNNLVFGEKALSLTSGYTKIFNNGTITDWDIYEKAMKNLINEELKINNISEHNVLLIEPALNPKLSREKLVQIAFEEFNVPALQIAVQPIMGLYATGRTTGTVVDIGEDICQILPIIDGFAHLHRCVRDRHYSSAGFDITKLLKHDLTSSNFDAEGKYKPNYFNNFPFHIIEEIKHNLCYVKYTEFSSPDSSNLINDVTMQACDTEKFLNQDVVEYKLPDGQKLELPTEICTNCTETLFQPKLLHKVKYEQSSKSCRDLRGLHVKIFECIDSVNPVDYWKNLYSNIVLIGGSTIFKNLSERLHKEMIQLAPPTMQTNITCSKKNKFTTWLGGAILTMLGSFHSMWVTAADYNANGPTFIHRKSLF